MEIRHLFVSVAPGDRWPSRLLLFLRLPSFLQSDQNVCPGLPQDLVHVVQPQLKKESNTRALCLQSRHWGCLISEPVSELPLGSDTAWAPAPRPCRSRTERRTWPRCPPRCLHKSALCPNSRTCRFRSCRRPARRRQTSFRLLVEIKSHFHARRCLSSRRCLCPKTANRTVADDALPFFLVVDPLAFVDVPALIVHPSPAAALVLTPVALVHFTAAVEVHPKSLRR